MSYIINEIKYTNQEKPSIEKIKTEMERISGLDVVFKEVFIDEESIEYQIMNDPSSKSELVICIGKTIEFYKYKYKLSYFEGILRHILVEKFNGVPAYEIFLPTWGAESWKGKSWWKKCKKYPPNTRSLTLMEIFKMIWGKR
jgi:hypothetical protein